MGQLRSRSTRISDRAITTVIITSCHTQEEIRVRLGASTIMVGPRRGVVDCSVRWLDLRGNTGQARDSDWTGRGHDTPLISTQDKTFRGADWSLYQQYKALSSYLD